MDDNCIKLNHENKVVEISETNNLSLEVLNDSTLTLKMLNFDANKNIKISAKVGQNSHLVAVFADFCKGNIELQFVADLIGANSSCEWHLATLADDSSNKKFDISFNHLVGHSNALMDNYGVARDKSKIVFAGVNHILNGAKKSVTNQVAKIIVFDRDSIGIASPKLCIDENDVQASHSAVVGQLNSDHMFYLMSRGLNKDEARELITRGYLQPISRFFNDKNREKIELAIKEVM